MGSSDVRKCFVKLDPQSTRSQTIFERQLVKLWTVCKDVVAVVSPQDQLLAKNIIQKSDAEVVRQTSIVLQTEALGTVHAAALGYWHLKKKHSCDAVAILWGDHYSVSAMTLNAACIHWAMVDDAKQMVVPVSKVENPYTYVDLDMLGLFRSLKRVNDGASQVPVGYQDLGVFVLGQDAFETALWHSLILKSFRGKLAIDEFKDIPQLINIFYHLNTPAKMLDMKRPQETRGINTPEELKQAESHYDPALLRRTR